MNKKKLKSKLTEMIDSFEEIILRERERNGKLDDLFKFRNELKIIVGRIDDEKEIDWIYVIAVMCKFVDFLYGFGSK